MRAHNVTGMAVVLVLLAGFEVSVRAETLDPSLSLSVRFRRANDESPNANKPKPIPSFPCGRPIEVWYTITNDSDSPVSFAESDFRAIPRDFKIRNNRGVLLISALELHRRGRFGKRLTIEPNRSLEFHVSLFDLYPPDMGIGTNRPTLYSPGRYTLCMHLNQHKAPKQANAGNLWVGSVKSDRVEFDVAGLDARERDALWKAFEKAKGKERLRIAMLITQMGGTPLDTHISRLVKDENHLVRTAVISAIARLGPKSEKHVALLEETLLQDRHGVVRAAAAYALGELGLKRSVPALIEAVSMRPERSYREAVRTLGKLGDQRAIPILEEVARADSLEWVRKAAKLSIQQIRDRAR